MAKSGPEMEDMPTLERLNTPSRALLDPVDSAITLSAAPDPSANLDNAGFSFMRPAAPQESVDVELDQEFSETQVSTVRGLRRAAVRSRQAPARFQGLDIFTRFMRWLENLLKRLDSFVFQRLGRSAKKPKTEQEKSEPGRNM